ncbi:MAG TPA: tetratricopeptide repeat protein [Candidatus Synoicihabitans sp.]|nr:tetratricopeptide repeat protein [Candidatus Synoicihabitans sp.]
MPEIAVSSLEPRLKRMVESADAAAAQGNLDYAMEVWGVVLRTVPSCWEVRQRRHEARTRQGEKTLPWRQYLAHAIRDRFSAISGSGSLEQRAERADAAVERDPTDVKAWRVLAEAAEALGWAETAVWAWQRASHVRGDDRLVLLGLSRASLAAGRATEAVAAAETLLRLYPHDGDGLAILRRASVAATMQTGRWDVAGDFRTKLRTGSDVPAAPAEVRISPPAGFAEQCADLANEFRARAMAHSGAEDSTAARDAAHARWQEVGREWQARARGWTEQQPHEPRAHLELGRAYLEYGDTAAAITAFQRARQLPAGRVAAMVGLGQAFARQGMWDLAIAELAAAKAEQPGVTELKKETLYELGCALTAAGRGDEAMEEFKLLYRVDASYRDVAGRIQAAYAR